MFVSAAPSTAFNIGDRVRSVVVVIGRIGQLEPAWWILPSVELCGKRTDEAASIVDGRQAKWSVESHHGQGEERAKNEHTLKLQKATDLSAILI